MSLAVKWKVSLAIYKLNLLVGLAFFGTLSEGWGDLVFKAVSLEFLAPLHSNLLPFI